MNDSLKIAIVGIPNEGKSSFVSTLAYNDGISVSSKSGETTLSSKHSLKIKSEVVYELYDTPGFDDDEGVLNYINDNKMKYSDIYELIRSFIKENTEENTFSKDIEILKVLMEKPIIIYIANSSVKYNSNFDDSLKIIKKFNLPSFIIYNQHDENKNEKVSWGDIEKKYFISSFEYNVLNSNFNNKIDFLEMIEQNIQDKNLKKQLCKSIEVLNKDFKRRLDFSYEELSDRFYKIINYSIEYSERDFLKVDKEKEFIAEIRNKEKSFYFLMEKEWGFYNLTKNIKDFKNIEITSKTFGSKKYLSIGILAGAGAGAAAGGQMDVGFFGYTFGIPTVLGTIGGGIVGGVSSIIGKDKINKKTGGFLNKKTTKLSIDNLNTKLSILSKLCLFVDLLSNRSHAIREEFTLEGKENLFDDIFNNEQQKEIRNILKEKDKNKFTTKLKEILLDNYYEKNKIKELKCN